MHDTLLTRAQLAVAEARKLREERKRLAAQANVIRMQLRLAILHCAALRVEIEACRRDKPQSAALFFF